MLNKLYQKLLLNNQSLIFLIFICLIGFFSYYSLNFRLDASSDSLNLENDKDIDYYRQMTKEFGSDEFLVITYNPINDDLFSDKSLNDLKEIKRKLYKISDIDNIVTILDIPLINSPKISFEDLPSGIRKISDEETDLILAKKELISSPLYSENLIDLEGEITTILVKFKRDETYHQLLEQRNSLRKLQDNYRLFDTKKLQEIEENFTKYHHNNLKEQAQNIAMIRQILSDYQNEYDIYIGGVPMIIADSIEFINKDIKIFGFLILFFTILTLLLIFRSLKWVIAPLLVCVSVIIAMLGFLGMINWPVTLVSSNFISLLFIITLSMNIHLMVRYKEIFTEHKKLNQKDLIFLSVKKMSVPCFYTAITTIVAFGSLVISDITPVIDFGHMMAIGIIIAYIFTFTLLPNLLLFNDDVTSHKNKEYRFLQSSIEYFYNLVEQKPKIIFRIFTILSILAIIGILQLVVENSFINYYKKSTEISQGMRVIDNKMGGTTPLNIVIDSPKILQKTEETKDEFEDFFLEEDFEEEICPFSQGYWYNSYNIKLIDDIHNYLNSLPETGKVMSLSNSFSMFKSLNSNIDLDNFTLTLACNKTSKEIKNILFYPYLSNDGEKLHFNVRIKETNEDLRRNDLINKLQKDLNKKFNLEENRIHINGMLVLYNNILQSLFESQILTLSFVFIVILGMFLILFRNVKLSLLAIIPNIIVAIFILGIMGWMNIPLDIMTITIAAIAIGIAVDDTIHYIHRFSEELKIDGDYLAAIKRSHNTIGRAMYYTTSIIGFGFFILVFSNFVPTVYFGFLTTLSMIFALIADFLLLPALLVKFKPILNVK